MNNINKKIMALLLALTLLLGIPLSMPASAADSEQLAKEALIEAWGNLSYEQYETLAYPTRVAVAAAGLKEELLTAGATEEQIAKFGTHIAKFTENKTSAEWSATTSVTTPATSYKKICFSAYSIGSTVIRYAIRGTNSKYNEGSYAYSEGYKELDITSKVSGWGESVLNDFRPYKESGAGTVYIGAVVGVKDVKATVPENATAMTAKELYDAAVALDLTKYTAGVTEFKAALSAFYKVAYPEAGALIEAWSNLQYTEGTVLGYAPGAKPIAEYESVLSSLSAEQIAKFGTHVGKVKDNAGASLDFPGNKVGDYEKITLAMYSGKTSGVQFTYNMGLSDGSSIKKDGGWTSAAVFTERDLSIDFGNTGFVLADHANAHFTGMSMSAASELYVGCIMGWKTVKATVPAGAETLTLKQLCKAAAQVDLSKYTEGVAEFEAALAVARAAAAAEDETNVAKDELIAAWDKLSKDSKLSKKPIAVVKDTTGYNGHLYTPITVDGNTSISGISDNAVLGGAYIDGLVPSDAAGASQGWSYIINFATVDSAVDLSKFNQIYFYAAAYDANNAPQTLTLSYQVSNGANGGADVAVGNGGWTKLVLNPTSSSVGHGFRFLVKSGQTVSKISFGSVVGEGMVNGEALPTNYANMGLRELVKAAKKVDYEGFGSGAAFKAALDEANALVDPSYELKEKLIEEWKKLSRTYEEQIATVKPVYADDKNVDHARTPVTDSTTIQGLKDASVLGTHYIDKIPYTKVGWQTWFYMDPNPDCIRLSKYSKMSVSFAIYDENGDFVNGQGIIQINNSPSYGVYGRGWTTINFADPSVMSNIRFLVGRLEDSKTAAYLSFGSVIGTYVVKAEIPENPEDMSLIQLVRAAEKCDVSIFEADAFKKALKDCQDFLKLRRETLVGFWDVAGEDKPSDIATMSEEALVEAARELEIADPDDASDFNDALWNMYKLTEQGTAVDSFSDTWKTIEKLPAGYKAFTLDEWIAAAEALDLNETPDVIKDKFEKELEVLKDLATKGKADVTELKKLVTDANKMNYYDYTTASWAPFGSARTKANEVLANYENVTKKQVDAAAEELLAAWGGLKMYVRTQWFDFMDYFLKTPADLGMSYIGSGTDTQVLATKAEVPNGANSAVQITDQPEGWNGAVISGEELADIQGSEYFEVWYRNLPGKAGNSQILFQIVNMSYREGYNVKIDLPEGSDDGEWHRLEVPISQLTNNDDSKPIVDNHSFVTATLRMYSLIGEGNYQLSNFALVKTEDVEAGVVPNVPKMVVKERQEVVYEPPKNPFEGVDRGDPWGIIEKSKNPNKKPTDDKTEDTDDKDETTDKTEVSVEAEGTCGEDLSWKFYSDGKLVISGSGDMENFTDVAPWVAEGCEVLSVEFDGDITSIGDSAFYGCNSLKEFNIPDTVTKIGTFAFYECESLKSVKITDTVTEIGAYSFGYLYDAESGTAVLLDGFKLKVVNPSKAYDYARIYEVDYEIYEDKTIDTDVVEEQNGFAWWIWVVIAAGGVLVLCIVIVLIVVISKKKKTKAEV